jgi:ribosomal protein S18 acetylase RimI-like enzyme
MHIFKPYRKELPGGLLLENTRTGHATGLEQLQEIVFPTLADDERFKAAHYLSHIQIFPEGQFVITEGGKIIAMTTSMRYHFEPGNYQHTFKQIMAKGFLTNHQPAGEWLYILDIGVHPAYRGRKLARELFLARNFTVERLGLKGQITVGMLNGFGAVKGLMSAEAYYAELLQGTRTDPTVTPQIKMGFEPLALIPDYLNDPACGNYGVFLKWENKNDNEN